MLKIRITFVDDKDGNRELDQQMEQLNENGKILYSNKRAFRGNSEYCFMYIDYQPNDPRVKYIEHDIKKE